MRRFRDGCDSEAFDDIEEGTVLLCWLPLANLFQRVINFYAIGRGAASYILSDPRDLMDHIGTVRPHILIGVPRMFERMQSGIMGRIAKFPLPLRHLTQWSLSVGRRQAVAKVTGKRPGIASKVIWHFADKLILSHLRAVFGKRVRYFISGSAAMPLWLLRWFEAIGLPVLEAYGISENIIPMSANRLSPRNPEPLGNRFPPIRSRLRRRAKFSCVAQEYSGAIGALAPGAERFTVDGYWWTGDVGRLDEEGFLSLLGENRKRSRLQEGNGCCPCV